MRAAPAQNGAMRGNTPLGGGAVGRTALLALALLAAHVAAVVPPNTQFVKLDSETTGCLDGSPYAFWVVPGNSSEWEIFISGGGWCLTEALCEARASTSALGSSIGYNISGHWGPTAANINGGSPILSCEGLDPNCTRVYLPYCDGSAFSSERAALWPVNGSNATLTFRGRANLDRTLDTLQQRFGFADAQRLVVTGGSAGGLSTFLHVDHIADRLQAAQAVQMEQKVQAVQMEQKAPPQVVGLPNAGFFIDGPSYNPSKPTFATLVQYGIGMFNATPPLSAACKAAHVGEEWKCWLAPYAAPFVRQPLFVVQSRFDEFQLRCLLGLPCMLNEPFGPPYNPDPNCSATERTAMVGFGADLLGKLQPFLDAKPESGIWLVSCIQHGGNAPMHGVPAPPGGGGAETLAFISWLNGGELGKHISYRWIDDCERNGTTPCNTGRYCAPPHF